jgi:hypothetical protein
MNVESAAVRTPSVAEPASAHAADEIRVRNMVLAPGDSVGLMFHPTARGGTVLVDTVSRQAIRVCAGDQFDVAVSPRTSSWGSHWRVAVCRHLDRQGRTRLPRYSEHVSIVILNADSSTHQLDAITLRYWHHDRYNVVRLPLLAPGATSPSVFIPTEMAHGQIAIVTSSASWQPASNAVLDVSSAQRTVGRVSGDGEANYSLPTTTISKRALRGIRVRIESASTDPIRPTIWFSTSEFH